MVSWINKEEAVSKLNDPPYRPYLIPKLTETPWMPAGADHTAARTKWVTYSKQAKRSVIPKEPSIRDCTLYRLRFIFAADCCQDWAKCGGLGPKLTHLSTVLHIGITESVGAALSYRRIANAELQEKDCERTATSADFVSISAAGNSPIEEQAKKEMAIAFDSEAKIRPEGQGGREEGRPFPS